MGVWWVVVVVQIRQSRPCVFPHCRNRAPNLVTEHLRTPGVPEGGGGGEREEGEGEGRGRREREREREREEGVEVVGWWVVGWLDCLTV